MMTMIDENGYYGRFGGAFIPEMMHKNINELQERYLEIIQSPDFIKQY
jgi:tryptophan synthase beta chain